MKKHKSRKKNKMKQLVLTSFMSLGLIFGSAGGKATAAVTGAKSNRKADNIRSNDRMEQKAMERAEHMSEMMIQDLQLNNYQSRKIREINLAKVREMMELEAKFANEPDLAAEKCLGACNAHDPELEKLLSTDQYSKYFGARNKYFNQDQSFAHRSTKTKEFQTASAEKHSSGTGGGVTE